MWSDLAMSCRSSSTRRQFLQTAASTLLLGNSGSIALSEESSKGKSPQSFAEVVRRRAMIRSYKSDPIPEEKLQRLLAYAVRAPSAGNLQPWEFIVVKDPEVRTKLAQATGNLTSVVTAPVSIITCADVQRASPSGARGSFFSLVDTSFASLLILLGAVEQGLGACFVGSYNPEEVAKLVELPDHVRPVGIITIGYPAERPQKPKTPKIPLQKLVHVNKW
jgi:nitroreductase